MLRALSDAPWLTADRALAWCRILLAATGLLVAAGLGWLALQGGVLDPFARPVGTDFLSFYAASSLALDGHFAAVWDMQAHAAAQFAIAGDMPIFYAFFYPPPFLLLVLPLALLPYAPALVLWLAATGYAYWRAIRALLPAAVPGFAILAFPAVLVNAGHGQNGFVSAALFGVAAAALDRRPWLAGACIGLLIYKPQLAILAPVALIAAGRWRAVLAAGAAVALALALSWIVVGTEGWRAFLAQAPIASLALEQNAVGAEKMQSVYAALRLLGAGSAVAYTVQGVAALATAILVAIAARQASGEAVIALLAAGAVLASPFLLDYDLLVLAAPMAFLAGAALRGDGFLPWEKTVLAAAFLLPLVARTLAMAAGLPVAPLVAAALLACVLRRARRGWWNEGASPLSEATG